MSQVKVVEIVAESNKSWQDAIETAVQEAAKSYSNITGIEVYNWTADCKNNKIVDYKADINIAYVE